MARLAAAARYRPDRGRCKPRIEQTRTPCSARHSLTTAPATRKPQPGTGRWRVFPSSAKEVNPGRRASRHGPAPATRN